MSPDTALHADGPHVARPAGERGRWGHMRRQFVLAALLGGATSCSGVGAGSEEPTICDEFRALGWPDPGGLSRFALTDTLQRGEKESAERHFYNIDVDGDDIEDPIALGCSASAVPADPCILEVSLSSGGSIVLEAWHLYLVRHRGLTYAIAADQEDRDDRIYRVGPKAVSRVCPST